MIIQRKENHHCNVAFNSTLTPIQYRIHLALTMTSYVSALPVIITSESPSTTSIISSHTGNIVKSGSVVGKERITGIVPATMF